MNEKTESKYYLSQPVCSCVSIVGISSRPSRCLRLVKHSSDRRAHPCLGTCSLGWCILRCSRSSASPDGLYVGPDCLGLFYGRLSSGSRSSVYQHRFAGWSLLDRWYSL